MTDFSRFSYSFFRGAFLEASSDTDAVFLPDAIAVVEGKGDRSGKIVHFGEASHLAKELYLDLSGIPRQKGLFLPAFFDLHFHWVQDAVREMPKTSLLEWLERYTFPTEGRFVDPDFAESMAQDFWKRILSIGTIGGLCYSSIHECALDAALRWAPDDFRIGNVLMTMNCPDGVRQTEAEAIQSVDACARRYGDRFVASPRFAPTTAPAVMEASARVAKELDCYQQTHLGETRAEIEWVLDLYRRMEGFEDVGSYTEIYDRVGMLGPKTVFGHCIHLNELEWKLLADSGSLIASCPSSNAPLEELGLGSGLFDFEQAEARGVDWGLASDIGGGPFLSMFDVMRSFVSQNRATGSKKADYTRALYRSTRKNAELLGFGDHKGQWREGFDFDCIRVAVDPSVLLSEDAEKILASIVDGVSKRGEYSELVEETVIRGVSRFQKPRLAERMRTE